MRLPTEGANMYLKLFEGFWDSSLSLKETAATRLAFLWLCTFADTQTGYVRCVNERALAKGATITEEEAKEAIKVLCEPDADSTNPEHEGRRIEKTQGGFIVLNGPAYRKIKDREMLREQERIRASNYRKRKKNHASSVTVRDACVTGRDGALLSASASAFKEGRESVRGKGTKEECRAYAIEIGMPESDGEAFFATKEANGWMNGKDRVRDWKATMRSWKENGYLKSQRAQGKSKPPAHYIPNPAEEKEWQKVPEEVKQQLTKSHTLKS